MPTGLACSLPAFPVMVHSPPLQAPACPGPVCTPWRKTGYPMPTGLACGPPAFPVMVHSPPWQAPACLGPVCTPWRKSLPYPQRGCMAGMRARFSHCFPGWIVGLGALAPVGFDGVKAGRGGCPGGKPASPTGNHPSAALERMGSRANGRRCLPSPAAQGQPSHPNQGAAMGSRGLCPLAGCGAGPHGLTGCRGRAPARVWGRAPRP